MMPHFELFLVIFLLLKGVFLNIKDLHMDAPYISMQLNYKNSFPMDFCKILCKSMEIGLKNSPKMEFCFFEAKIWYTWLALYKDAMIIMLTKI